MGRFFPSLSKKLSTTAQTATVLPHLKSTSLISLGQICDDNCTVVLNRHRMIATKNSDVNIKFNEDDIVLQGQRNIKDGLYDVTVPITKIVTDNYCQPPIHPNFAAPTKRLVSAVRAPTKPQCKPLSTPSTVSKYNIASTNLCSVFCLHCFVLTVMLSIIVVQYAPITTI